MANTNDLEPWPALLCLLGSVQPKRVALHWHSTTFTGSSIAYGPEQAACYMATHKRLHAHGHATHLTRPICNMDYNTLPSQGEGNPRTSRPFEQKCSRGQPQSKKKPHIHCKHCRASPSTMVYILPCLPLCPKYGSISKRQSFFLWPEAHPQTEPNRTISKTKTRIIPFDPIPSIRVHRHPSTPAPPSSAGTASGLAAFATPRRILRRHALALLPARQGVRDETAGLDERKIKRGKNRQWLHDRVCMRGRGR